MRSRTLGTILLSTVVMAGCTTTTQTQAPLTSAKPVSPAQQYDKKGAYIVQSGDTLYSVAWRFGLDYRDIIANNKLHAPYALHQGEHLKLVEHQRTAPAGLGNPPVINRHLRSQYATNPTSVIPTPVPTAKATKSRAVATPAKTPQWIWPTPGRVSQRYSLNSAHPNKGINISGKAGQAIVAAATGEVVYSGNGIPGYGNLIIIKHNTLYLTAYAQNEKNLVKEGQKVKQGQKIATMGVLSKKQAELHFEIRYAGKPVNPQNYLPSLH